MPLDIPTTVDYLLSPQAVRDRCQILFDLACKDQLDHFRCDLERLPAAADYVINVMQAQYPDGDIPFHSRWRHFEVDGRSRLNLLEPHLSQMDALERARLRVDLAIVSVLLDAGAGEQWRFVEPETGREFQRSEGLAIASFHSFRAGLFSSDANAPWQANAAGLTQITSSTLASNFQVTEQNPLVGVGGRTTLLQKLGQELRRQPQYFGKVNPRPGHLVDFWLAQSQHNTLAAPLILKTVLQGLRAIWPDRLEFHGVNLGDVWPHPKLSEPTLGGHLVPFHKLSQWLTYSLLEPLQELGLKITELEALTGLAEYRNGGLFVDIGVVIPKYADVLAKPHSPSSTIIVEWRALTIILLDHVATQIRQQLGYPSHELPLPKILQGGTWAAGRQIARHHRSSGNPPIKLLSDGTVF